MSFWAPVPKSTAENGIPKKSLDASLTLEQCVKYIQTMKTPEWRLLLLLLTLNTLNIICTLFYY